MFTSAQINDFIIENELTTQESIDLASTVAGYCEETMNGIIYALTGFHDIEQLYKCAKNEFYFNDEILAKLNK